jgi:hypothetical protein
MGTIAIPDERTVFDHRECWRVPGLLCPTLVLISSLKNGFAIIVHYSEFSPRCVLGLLCSYSKLLNVCLSQKASLDVSKKEYPRGW